MAIQEAEKHFGKSADDRDKLTDMGDHRVVSVEENLAQMRGRIGKAAADPEFLFGGPQNDPAGIDPAAPAPGTRYKKDAGTKFPGEKTEYKENEF